MHTFESHPNVRGQHKRSQFNLSNGHKTTFNAGKLIPIKTIEVLPGDVHILDCYGLVRLATPLFPFMDNLYVDYHAWFVPNRLVWDEKKWEEFITVSEAKPSDWGNNSNPPLEIPHATAPAGGWQGDSFYDYLGLPIFVNNISCNFFYESGYRLIWNEFYRDQNVQNPLPSWAGFTSDFVSQGTILTRQKRHDYFTSCLPLPQKGPAVTIPLGGTADIIANGPFTLQNGSVNFGIVNTLPAGNPYLRATATPVVSNLTPGSYVSGLQADLSSATAVTINALRNAYMMQVFFEINARSGSRYTEYTVAHFGVHNKDYRLQRPEYLGGSTTNISAIPVANTSDATGKLAAFAMNFGKLSFRKSFTEHGTISIIASVRADLTYQQGIERRFSRRFSFDYYVPVFAHLGEMPVYNKELYADGTNADNNVFGYQEHWSDYRFSPSKITGKFRSVYNTLGGSLDTWHLAQYFSNRPALNSTFMVENPPVNRILAVTSEPQFKADLWFNHRALRIMPTHSTPGFGNKF